MAKTWESLPAMRPETPVPVVLAGKDLNNSPHEALAYDVARMSVALCDASLQELIFCTPAENGDNKK